MQAEHQKLWQHILQLTQQLHLLSLDENWDSMTEVESRRRDHLQTFFSTPVAEQDAQEVSDGIQQILASDKALMKSAVELKQQTMQAIQKISSSRKAVNIYQQIQP